MYEILLDIQKSYDALDHNLCLNILAEYTVVPWSLRLLRHYWPILTMVVQTGGYFGTTSKGYRKVTQEEPLSPTIFNLVVYAVFWHWFTVVVLT